MFRTALRMTGSDEEAADLTQQAVLRALGGWGGFNGHASPATWVFRILMNCVTDWRRRLGTAPSPIPEEFALADPRAPDAADEASRREDLEGLRWAIRNLPPALGAPFVLTILDGYTYEEAAEMLSLPVGTVAYRVYESRKLLKAALRPSSEAGA